MENKTEKSNNQFSIRILLILMAAFAAWAWVFQEIKPSELAIFTSIAIVTGILAHLVYAFVLPWRIIGIASVILFYTFYLIGLEILGSNFNTSINECSAFVFHVVYGPFVFLIDLERARDIRFSVILLLLIFVFTPAHAIKPSYPTAIISALGVGFWYMAGILIMMYAG